ncbi:MAG TPA: hypothetical protein VFL10_09500 [Ornithinibacter sp.]|nr:hypothetical protein [Ornithinibacter sp.]
MNGTTGQRTAQSLRAVLRAVTASAALVVVLVTAGCSPPQQLEEPRHDGPPDVVPGIPADQLPSFAAHLTSSGRTAYYLGPTARGLELTSFAEILDTPSILAANGTCDPGESGCEQPVMVFTAPWEREPAGFECRPLTPRLSVPTLLVSGEVNLYTGRQVVRVLDVLDGDPAGGKADHALALVPGLRSLDAARPASALPPPDPEVASWIAQVCPPPSAAAVR